jgi:hypothetical protein
MRRALGRAAVTLLLVVAVLGGGAARAEAAKGGKRRIAVLEVRTGATGASDLGLRLALILRRTTSLDVLDGDDARRVLGARMDDELARCAGEPACVARVGARLKADDVLLVGISELGDLIVALQIVEVKTGKVRARVNESLAADEQPDDNRLEGYLRRLLPRGDFRRFGVIRVSASVDGAAVEIGGIPRGRTPLAPVVVEAPERYDVRVRKSGYEDFTAEIDVPPDATVEVRPKLAQKGAGAAPWYGKWWVWAIAGTVVTGAVVGAIVLSQDDPTAAGVIVEPF